MNIVAEQGILITQLELTIEEQRIKIIELERTIAEQGSLPNNESIKSGIYVIDKKYCKKYVALTSNNKTNHLIDSKNLHKMLKRSIQQKYFIELPIVNKLITYNPFTSSAY